MEGSEISLAEIKMADFLKERNKKYFRFPSVQKFGFFYDTIHESKMIFYLNFRGTTAMALFISLPK